MTLMWKEILAAFCCLLVAFDHSGTSVAALRDFEVIHSWSYLDFDFPSEVRKLEAVADGLYDPKNCTLTGIKVFQDTIFVTVSRWASGVPSTLNLVDNDTSLLVPWPSWEMQTIGDCDKLQFVQSMEIEPTTRTMWVIDTGVATGYDYPTPCPAKLVVFDLSTGNVLRRHNFPTSVVPPENFLNDIVLDLENPEQTYAYISDVFVPGIVVYDAANDRSWRAYHKSMENEPGADLVDVPGQPVTLPEPNTDGIALSPRNNTENRRVYYTPLAGYSLYSVDTSILKDELTATDEPSVSTVVQKEGTRTSQTDGMIMSADGYLYFGVLNELAVAQWDTATEMANNTEVILKGPEFEWADTFSISDGYLYMTSNRLNRFFSGVLDINEINFRVVRSYIGVGSYLDP